MSQVQQQAAPKSMQVQLRDAAKTFLNDKSFQDQLKQACNSLMKPERVARIALTAATKTPKLMECFSTIEGKASVARALLDATQMGLEVDGRQGHLVPFKCKIEGGYAMMCQFIPGYQGLVQLGYRHPQVAGIWADVVYEKDHFVFTKGLELRLEHVSYDGEEDPGPLKAAYAVVKIKDGMAVPVVLYGRDIKRIRAKSRGASDDSSPWNTDEAAMWKKSAIRALAKIMPASAELIEALDADDKADSVSVSTDDPVPIRRANVTQVSNVTPPALPEADPSGEPPPEPVVAPQPAQNTTPSVAAAKRAMKPKTDPKPPTTVQEIIAQKAMEIPGSNFEEFIKFCAKMGWVTDPTIYGGFDFLPVETCNMLIEQWGAVKAAYTNHLSTVAS